MASVPPRRRGQGPAWMGRFTDRLTPTVKTLIIADTAIYLFYVLVRPSRAFMEVHLALGPRFFAGEIWQPLTALFVHLDFLGFLFGMVGLWFIGSFIEQTRGSRRCAALFLGAGVAANLTVAGVSHLRGLSPTSYNDGVTFAVTALFVAFGRLFGRQTAQVWPIPISIQARILVVVLVGWQAAASLARGDLASLAGLGVTVVIGYFGAGPGGLTALRTFFANARDMARARRIRRRFGVIQGGERPPKKKYVN